MIARLARPLAATVLWLLAGALILAGAPALTPVGAALAASPAIGPLLQGIAGSAGAGVGALIVLAGAALLGLLELRTASAAHIWADAGSGEDLRVFRAATIAWLVVFGFTVTGALHDPALAARPLVAVASAAGLAALTHLLLALGLFAVLHLVRLLGRSSAAPARTELWLVMVLVAAAAAALLSGPLDAMGYSGWRQYALAGAWPVAGVLVLAALGAGRLAQRPSWIENGADVFLHGVSPSPAAPALARVAFLLAATGLSGLLIRLGSARPGFALALSAAAAAAAFTAGYRVAPAPRGRRDRRWVLVSLCAVVAVAHMAAYRMSPLLDSSRDLAPALERYASLDPIYGAIDSATSLTGRSDTAGFYALLHARAARLLLTPPAGQPGGIVAAAKSRPAIFLITIQGLRRDHTPPHAAAASVPALAALAADATVFGNAFTRHTSARVATASLEGGLTLSGWRLPPVSTHGRLTGALEAAGYRTVMTPRAPMCAQLTDVQTVLSSAAGAPVLGLVASDELLAPGLSKEGYAAKLQEIDACVGRFVEYLKAAGIYERAVIVLASTHGRSFDPAIVSDTYALTPDVARVPLLIRVGRGGTAPVEKDGLVFTTDIVPTIEEIVFGRSTVADAEGSGRSLLAPRPARPIEMISAGDAPVFGLVLEEGRRLFVSDALRYRDAMYDLRGDGWSAAELPGPRRVRQLHRRIADALGAGSAR